MIIGHRHHHHGHHGHHGHHYGACGPFLGGALLCGFFLLGGVGFVLLAVAGVAVLCWLVGKGLHILLSKTADSLSGVVDNLGWKWERETIRKQLDKENDAVEEKARQLAELRKTAPDPVELERDKALCTLMEQLCGAESMSGTRKALSEQASRSDQIRPLVRAIREHMESCKKIGDTERCLYFAGLLGDPQIDMVRLRFECEANNRDYREPQETEDKLELVAAVVSLVVAMVLISFIIIQLGI